MDGTGHTAVGRDRVKSFHRVQGSPSKIGLMISPETVMDSWKTVRQDTARSVEDFPAAELDFKPTAEVMTFREIARHILEAGYAMTGLLLDGVENMATPAFRE